jgi:hypothetical protein
LRGALMEVNPWAKTAPPPEGDVTEEEQRRLIEKIAEEVVARGLAAPAIFLLESSKPFSFLGSQALVFLSPIVKSFLNLRSYDVLTEMLEDRTNVERLLQEIERREAETQEQRKIAREQRRKQRGTRGLWRRKRER